MSSTANLLTEGSYDWMTKPHECCICEKEFTGWGNNPEPIKRYPDRCCNRCNNNIVIPWRVQFGRDFAPTWIRHGLGKSVVREWLRTPFHTENEPRYRATERVSTRHPISPEERKYILPDKLAGMGTFPGDAPEKDDIDAAIDDALHDLHYKQHPEQYHQTASTYFK